ncbi:MAG: MBG domain-containing protein, partial [Tannerella sp.]|nr:MBG domain-containing protein [Tannerella sp.]
YDLAAVPYTGKPQGIAPPTLKSPLAGGDITVKYGGSPTVPVNVGTYAVTVDVENVTDYVDTLGMPLGDFVIRKAVPTAAYLDYVLSDFIYDGESHGITVKPKEGVVGLGAITVRYDGSESPPEAEGEYAVTVDIVESDNYEAVTLELGHIVIYRMPRPNLIRKVTVEPSAYYDISPSPGVHSVESGRDMILTLTPLASLPSGYVPQVTTDRRLVPDSEQSIEILPNADGTYTVRIRSVLEAAVVTVTAVAFQSADRIAPAQVWSYGRQLYVAASVSGRAYIYNVSGRVVKIVPTVAGETVAQALSPGIYFVSTGGKSFKVVIIE